MEEIWKPIKNYEDRYLVSNRGQIKSKSYSHKGKNYKEIILKIKPNKKGYCYITLTNSNEIRKTFKVHRLVAKAFIPNYNNKEEINHKDGNRSNNCVDNLEWCNHSENIKHSFEKLNRKVWSSLKDSDNPKKLKNKIKEAFKCREIQCIETGEIFYSLHEAERSTTIDSKSISRCCHGKQHTAGGYHWKFTKNTEKHIPTKKLRCLETNIVYDSVREASEKTGIPYSNLTACCNKDRNSSYGYHWEYID